MTSLCRWCPTLLDQSKTTSVSLAPSNIFQMETTSPTQTSTDTATTPVGSTTRRTAAVRTAGRTQLMRNNKYSPSLSTENLKPRFYKEYQKTPNLPSSEGTCHTTNTTTFYKSQTGHVEAFTLFNPAGCSFPFNYKGTWYNQCIAEDDPFCRKCWIFPSSN